MSEIFMGDSYSDTKLMSSLSVVSVSSNPSFLLKRHINFLFLPFAAEVFVLDEISSSTKIFHNFRSFRFLLNFSLRNEFFGVFC